MDRPVRLEYDGKKLTLNGKVVTARRIGPPVMAYWVPKFEDSSQGLVSLIFKEDELPILSSPSITTDANAYALAIGERPLIIGNDHNRAFSQKWTAVQLYHVQEKYLPK